MALSADNSRPILRASLWLTGLGWTLPFLQPYHRFPLTGFYSEWLAFAFGLAAAIFLATRVAWREASIPVVAAGPVALIVVLALQAAVGRMPYAEQGLTATLYLLWASLLIVLGFAIRRAGGLEAAAVTLAWFLAAGGCLGAVAGLLQHYHYATPLDFLVAGKSAPQVTGNLGQPNQFATYLALALASVLYLYGRRAVHGALAGAMALLLLLVLSLTGSRSTWLYLAAFAALAVVLCVKRRDAGSLRLVAACASLLPAYLVVHWIVTLPAFAPAGREALTTIGRVFELPGGVDARLQLWGEAWDLFLGAPILGAGLGRFAWQHFLFQADTGATAAPGVFNHAHNLFMQLLAETGVLGLAAVAGAILLWLADLRKIRLDLDWWWLLAILGVLGLHSLLEHPLWYSYFLGVAALLIGLGAQSALALRFPVAARLTAGLLVLGGAVNLAAVLPAYRHFERLVFSTESLSAPLSEAAYRRAVSDLYREPLLVPYLELAIAYGIAVSDDGIAERLALSSRAMHFAPTSIAVYRNALMLAQAGERAAALRRLARALRVYPDDARVIIAELRALARGRPDVFLPLLELARGKRAAPPSRATSNP